MALSAARIRAIAAALVTDLNDTSHEWHSQLANPVRRSYRQTYQGAELDTLRVDVCMSGQDWPELLDGVPTEDHHCVLFVFFQQRINWSDIDAVDTMIDLVSAIATHYKLESLPFAGEPGVRIVDKSNPIIVAPNQGEQRNTYYGVIVFEFSEWI